MKPSKPTKSTAPQGAWARYLNMAIGCWLFLSAFIWRHTANGQSDAWSCGVLIFFFALWALVNPAMRWVTGLVGAWLLVTTLVISVVDQATAINGVLCGAAVVLLALVPNEPLDLRARQRQART